MKAINFGSRRNWIWLFSDLYVLRTIASLSRCLMANRCAPRVPGVGGKLGVNLRVQKR